MRALDRCAAVVRALAVVGGLVTAGSWFGCGKLQGLTDNAAPLVTFNFVVTGDIAPVRPAGVDSERALQVALVWGEQWLTEPFCILPPENSDAATVIGRGCRDAFGFVPARVGADVPVTVGVPTTISLRDLPSADLMVGDITSRVAYASLVLYDDRATDGGMGDGTLDLALPHRLPSAGPGPPQVDTPDSGDIIYGASFLTMLAPDSPSAIPPDQRTSYLEGSFTPSGFYPRPGCSDQPLPGFLVLSAGGFPSPTLAQIESGNLPPEDPATCTHGLPADTTITIAVQPPATVEEAGCMERTDDSSTRYRQPPFDNGPDLTPFATACVHLPSFEQGDQPNLMQLVISGRDTDRCKGLTHYTLRGCRNDVTCDVPQWDYTANPPPWWPSQCRQ